ncbi:SDR family NAD(P)-dependent oxidoreductase [Streptomyces sp. NPDC007856]|uniref:SDR family NAD(P)-dependent oxidoreductase n=1 Tax=Streptomyces sp. NPDC007856 TaxID=3364781 RepID=UPI0036C7363C
MNTYPDDSIAVIGLASRFPGARNTADFWDNLTKGQEAVTFPEDAELLAAGVRPELLADASYVKAYAETPDIEAFDAEFFGFTPRDAAVLDPQIRMFLEVAHDAVENAGYDPQRIAEGVGVFGSTGVNTYLDVHVRAGAGYQLLSASGLASSTLSYPDFLATHVAYRFGFRGPALTISTACSSSAVATHLACQALRAGECDYAIAGGSEAEIPVHHGYQWDPGGPMSSDGHCRPFDKHASGTVFSTGAGAILLKRLSDAIADGDHIWAVIRSSAVNNDGATKAGFSAPSVVGQVGAMAEAMALAGVTAADIDFVEAHGTGTSLGDPIEVAALTAAFEAAGAAERTSPVALSSVKGNIGHLGHAAGISALVKAVLCLAHEQRVPTANFTEPNPRLKIEQSPFRVDDALVPWPRTPDRPRFAAVNSLGFGGTNAHLILQEAPVPTIGEPHQRPQVIVWSARSEQAVRDYEPLLVEHLGGEAAAPLADVAGTLQDGRTEHPVRAAVVADEAAEVAEAVARDKVVRSTGGQRRPIVFAFPGQGSQHPRMAAGLHGADPVFTRTLDECFERFERLGTSGAALREAWSAGDAEAVVDTAVAQPLLFAVEYALAAMWRSWGVEPAGVVGHSVGEITAAAVAGVLEPDDAARLVLARATAMAAMEPGVMASVAATPSEVAALLPDGATVAVVNGPRQTVVAGAADRMTEALAVLDEAGLSCRRLATSHAFHSPSMAAAVDMFAAAFDGVVLREPQVPMVSAATGEQVSTQALDPMFWARQLVEPVRFDLALDQVLGDSGALVIEAGPGRVLTSLVRQYPADRSVLAVPTLTRTGEGDDLRAALSAAATVWVEGHTVDWEAIRGRRPVRRVPLPGYQYQRSRHWLELPGTAETSAPTESPRPEPNPTEEPVTSAGADPFTTFTWVERPHLEPSVHGEDLGTALALLPEEPEDALRVLLSLRQAGYRPVGVRTGNVFEAADDEFRVRLASEDDLDRVFEALAHRGEVPRLLVHALTVPAWPQPTAGNAAGQLDEAYHSLTALVRCGTRHVGTGGVLVITGRSADVTGAEPVDPVKAALHGAVRTLALEAPELTCRLVDVCDSYREEDLAAEIASPAPEPVVALRGRGRWVRAERVYRPAASTAPALRRCGVYVLTGGFGGLGGAVAQALAGTGMRPHLVLAGRNLPSPERLKAQTAQLERLGATVQAEACDIADGRAVRRLFDKVRARHGAVNGVVHLAGIAGDGLLLGRRREEAEAVLRPKVQGTLALTEALSDHPPLDFIVLFSSRAALNGLVGSADYSAANCFLDAYARSLTREGVTALSVNWPSWRDAGMAARDDRPAGTRVWTGRLDAATDPMLDEHRVGAKPVMPGTGHLDMVVRAFREAIGPRRTPVRLSDVVFQQALVVERPRDAEIAFEPDGAGWRFTLSSRTAEGSGAAITHSTGTIAVLDTPRLAPGSDLSALRARLSTPAVFEVATQMNDAFFTFGPRWDNIEKVTVGTDGHLEKLVDMVLAAPFAHEVADYPLYPTLLDNATAEARTSGIDAAHLPFGYDAFEVYEDLPARLTSHIRRRPAGDGLIVADIGLYAADDGRPVGRIDGYTMRRISDDGFVAGPPAGQRPADSGTTAATGVEGIAPAAGGRLFLALLGAGRPSQVAVRPYVDDSPVPLAEAEPAGAVAVPSVPLPVAVVRPAVPAADQAPTVAPVPVMVPAQAQAQAPAAQGGAVLERLGALWTKLLGREVAPDDDFFELGGSSLTAVELMAGIREEFGIRVGIVTMFDNPTLRAFADVLQAQGAS